MVNFWVKVFTRYPTRDVIFHDEKNLNRIYSRIRLRTRWRGTRAQGRRIRRRRRQIEYVIRSLASGRMLPPPDRRLARRIKKMFRGHSRRSMRRAAFLVRAQPGMREHFREGYVRSGRYLAHFRRIFRRHGLPQDLVLLPHVESGFRNAVYSKARALGMWQFTRGTARLFMRVDSTVDARRDPFMAAESAARLLKSNYRILKTWPLAITAYNHGTHGMRRAVLRLGTRNIAAIVSRYKGRYFGFASRNFYAEFLAAIRVHKNAKRYFGPLRVERPLRFDVYPVPVRIRMGDLSRRIGISKRTLRPLNPALRPRVFRGSRRVPRGYPLRLPKGLGLQARRAFSRGGKMLAASAEDGTWVHVRPGDTLSQIARRNRVSLLRLMKENELEDALIYPGDRLKLPERRSFRRKGRRRRARVVRAKRRMRTARRKNPRPIPPTHPPIIPLSQPKAPGPGRTASRGSSVPLKIRGVRRMALRVSMVRGTKIGLVLVQENETLGHFARWLRTSPRTLRRLNRLRRGRRVRMDRVLRIPLRRVSKEAFSSKRMAFHWRVQRAYSRRFIVTGTVRHKLRRRQNIWVLIRRVYKVPYWLVQDFNPGKDLRKVLAGEVVVLPVVRPRKKG